MSSDNRVRELTEEQMEEIGGGYIYPSAWSKLSEMASQKKSQGMTREQFQEYLWKWRAETGMKGFTNGNLNRDFDSILEYCYEDWNQF